MSTAKWEQRLDDLLGYIRQGKIVHERYSHDSGASK